MKICSLSNLQNLFASLEEKYELLLPVRLLDGTRSLGRLKDGDLHLEGGALPMRPAALFMPYLDLILKISKEGTAKAAPNLAKPLFIVGFTAEDLACLEFTDKFFSTNFYDEIYFKNRQDAVVVGVSGYLGSDGEFLKVAGGKCDLEIIKLEDGGFIIEAYSEKGSEILKNLNANEADSQILEVLKEKSANLVSEDEILLRQASQLLLEGRVPDEFWQDIAKRCIACTACTLVCPTCTCFDVFDRKTRNSDIERMRLRDSCQLDGFMREASGHNPMAKEFLRTRRRIHHKLVADVRRFGHITCYFCGRCDQACPTGIGIKSVCREMVARYWNVV
ncbi:MAG: 4Fe-4S dicluster domain-containing protein [Gammaproteobacteria bacterium]|jgi:formate hydrogenlyase subunit 6/NADH:ubiquinone oxidoreductase subunit I